ncbi:DUF397 domain-containing protein [Actinokineospora sp.]|uniref:DUF397 domain-containing protein n=1 Tax=Actinokineospora sp. TaxID=1872133 RepID=UPI00403784C4
MTWRKSSFSGNANACVEVWRKSSLSGNANECVEVVGSLDRLRDSKNPTGPVLRVDLTALLAEIRSGQFAR